MRVIVAGSRTILNAELVYATLDTNHRFSPVTEIVSGGANGPDKIGAAWGVDNNISVRWFYAQWKTYGRAAGYIRNAEMATYATEEPQRRLIAFWDNQSRGTANMIDLANKFKIETIIVPCQEAAWYQDIPAIQDVG